MGERGGDFKSWVIQIPWNTLEPKLQKLMSYAKEQGAKSFGTIGCCWGGWAAFHASAMSADISCGVIFHPSCQLEGMFGGDVVAYQVGTWLVDNVEVGDGSGLVSAVDIASPFFCSCSACRPSGGWPTSRRAPGSTCHCTRSAVTPIGWAMGIVCAAVQSPHTPGHHWRLDSPQHQSVVGTDQGRVGSVGIDSLRVDNGVKLSSRQQHSLYL